MADINSNSPYLTTIENAIRDIQNKKNISSNLELIKKMVNKEFNTNCVRLILTNNNTTNYFFGMHVFPTQQKLIEISDKIIRTDEKVKFESCKEFIIEFDSKLIYEIGATPKEITAALIHEIGHKAFSTKEQVRSYLIFTSEAGRLGYTGYMLFSRVSPLKFLLISAIMFTFSGFLKNLVELKGEMDADSLAVKYGYGKDLYSLFNKLTSDDLGRMVLISNNRGKKSDEERLLFNWSIKNILDFQLRKNKIKRDIEEQMKNENSEAVKEVLKAQLDFINRSKASFNISTTKSEDVLNESILSFIDKKRKGYSGLELDELEVEIQRIEDYEDKIYLINRIHKDLNIADGAIKKIKEKNDKLNISSNKDDEIVFGEIEEYKRKLNEMLSRIKSTKIEKREFGITMAYPLGYKG